MEPKVIEKVLVNDKINKINAVSTTTSLYLAELGHI